MAKRVLIGLCFVVGALLIITIGASLAQDGTDRPQDDTFDPASSTAPQAIMATEAITVAKQAEPSVVDPGGDLRFAYVVTFTNDSGTAVSLDQIFDTLPTGFAFGGAAPGNQVGNPIDEQEPTIVWQGPFSVPGNGTLKMRYWVEGVTTPGLYTNKVEGRLTGGSVVQATADVIVQGALLSLGKGASPGSVSVGGTVTYDVSLSNTGNVTGTLNVVSDTLPAGFAFLGMAPDSDVAQPPVGTSGTLVWTGPFTISPGAELHLIYTVSANEVGTFTNSVVAQDAGGELLDPAESQVTVGKMKVFLPLVPRYYPEYIPPPPPYYYEGFTYGVPDEWTPFVNWPELNANQWKASGDGETWGRLDFFPNEALEQWALNMYLAPGTQEWTNYRVEASIRSDKVFRHPLFGLWFRGTYEERTDNLGGVVTGYMVTLRPDKNQVYLQYVDPNDRTLSFKSLDYATHGININTFYTVTVVVQGSYIEVWVDDVRHFQFYDDTWSHGTVGFGVYRGNGGIDWIRVTQLPD